MPPIWRRWCGTSSSGTTSPTRWKSSGGPRCGRIGSPRRRRWPPVLVVLDARLQKARMEGAPPVPPISRPRFPSADPGSVREIARMLVDAENPRITAGLAARTQEGIDRLVELAELLQVAVDGGRTRLNFPSRHPLAGTGTGQPDVILNLEPGGRRGSNAGVRASGRSRSAPPSSSSAATSTSTGPARVRRTCWWRPTHRPPCRR